MVLLNLELGNSLNDYIDRISNLSDLVYGQQKSDQRGESSQGHCNARDCVRSTAIIVIAGTVTNGAAVSIRALADSGNQTKESLIHCRLIKGIRE